MIRVTNALFAILALFTLAACDPTRDLDDAPAELGDFKLGHTVVVLPKPQVIPGSRTATDDEWKAAMSKAITERFGRYSGDKLYHFGISIDAYNLAAIDIPGVPTPKSALGITVTLWDNAAGKKLNEKGKVITVLGVLSGAGVQPTKEVQLDNLSALAVKSIETWLLEHPEWFAITAK